MPYIAVEGCIASGKTTLAKAIALRFGIRSVLEDYHDVPSLEQFYRDPETYAFETEIQFTEAHYNRLISAFQDNEDSTFVTDFTLERDLVFASVTLVHQPLKLAEYKSFWQDLVSLIPEPDRIILLEVPMDELLRRVRQRGRPFEQEIGGEYLERLVSGLRELYRDAPEESIRRLNSTNLTELLRDIPNSLLTLLGSGPGQS